MGLVLTGCGDIHWTKTSWDESTFTEGDADSTKLENCVGGAWQDEPVYRTAMTTFAKRAAFILGKLREHDAAKLQTVMGNLYRESDWSDPEKIADVQKRMGRVWR